MTTETATGAGLFKNFGEGGGGWFKPENGFMCIGEFTGASDGGEQEFEGKKSKAVWWHFDCYEMADPTKRVRYVPTEGENAGKEVDAVADGRTTNATGPKSKARAWYSALVKRVISNEEDVAAVYAESVGKRALLVFGPSDSDATKIILKDVLRFNG